MLFPSLPRIISKHSLIFDSLLLGVLLSVFYFMWLGDYPLFTPDEGRYAEVAREMLVSKDWISPRVNGVAFLDKPILYYWLEAASIKFFGLNEWAIRFFPALFGILGSLLTYYSGRYLFNRETGLLAAIILATSPLYFISAHYANLDLEVAIWISAALLLFICAFKNLSQPNQMLLILAYFCSALAILTKGLIGIAFPALIISTWMMVQGHFVLIKKMKLFLGLSIIAAMVIPWYYLVQQANPQFLHYFFVTQHITRFLSAGEFNNKTILWFYFPVVILGFFPWILIFISCIRFKLKLDRPIKSALKLCRAHPIQCFLIIWIAVIFIFFSIPRSKIITYILPIFPALALLAAHTLRSHANTQPSCSKMLCVLYACLSILLAISISLALYFAKLPLIPSLSIVVLILLLSACLSPFMCKRKCLALCSLFVVSNILILTLLTASAPYLNERSMKSLSLKLKPYLTVSDEVVSYEEFYQDLPIYLERRITISTNWQDSRIPYKDNWKRELWFGKDFQKTENWLIQPSTFWKKFNSKQRIFVFTNQKYLPDFKAQAKQYFILGKEHQVFLISNHVSTLVDKLH